MVPGRTSLLRAGEARRLGGIVAPGFDGCQIGNTSGQPWRHPSLAIFALDKVLACGAIHLVFDAIRAIKQPAEKKCELIGFKAYK